MSQSVLVKERFRDKLKSDDLRLAKVPSTLCHPYRVLIMKVLLNHGQVDFRDLKNNLKLTSGNLASHLRALKKGGYVRENKEIIGSRPRTSYEFTKDGFDSFKKLKESLLGVLSDEQK